MSLMARISAIAWALEPAAAEKLLAIAERHDAGIKLDDAQIRSAIGRAPKTPNPRDRAYDIHQGVAIVPVQGVLHKHAAQVQNVSGPSGTSYEQILGDVRTALADPDVRSILLHVESPGGAADAMGSTSSLIADAGSAKPVWSLIDGMGASAAYGLAVAAAPGRVYATPSSLVGSIGTMMAMRDTSAAAEKSGVKTHVVRSSPLKGGAVSGEKVTDAHLADQQRLVDGLAAQFYALVGDRRNLSGDALAAVTDGRVHLAADAQALGLIDGVASLEQVLALMTDPSQHAKKPSTRPAPAAAINAKEPTAMKIAPEKLAELVSAHEPHAKLIVSMATGSADKAAATEAEIISALKDADLAAARSALEQTQAKLTAADAAAVTAATAHAAALTAKDSRITALESELAEAKAFAGKAGTKALDDSKAGAAPVDAIKAYTDTVAALKAAGDRTPYRTIATKPEYAAINAAYIVAAQPKKGASK
jgi:signal peptide peptidase SppA